MKNSLVVTAAPEQHAMLDQKRFDLFKLILQTTLVAGILFGGANLLLYPTSAHPLVVAFPVLIFSVIALLLLKAGRITMRHADHAIYAAKGQPSQLVKSDETVN